MVGELDWSTVYDVIDRVSTVVSIPVAVGGFWIAIAQINKTKDAAIAARNMATTARKDANRASVLVLLPQLQYIEGQIDRAVEDNSIPLVIAWANTWRWQASQLNEHLGRLTQDSHSHLPPLLQTSVLAAADTKMSLVGKQSVDLKRATKAMRDAVTAVTSQLGGLSVYYSALPDRSTS